jgi:DNA modification methylase
MEACHKTGRIFRGSELDPAHIKTILDRYQKITGEAAIEITQDKTAKKEGK